MYMKPHHWSWFTTSVAILCIASSVDFFILVEQWPSKSILWIKCSWYNIKLQRRIPMTWWCIKAHTSIGSMPATKMLHGSFASSQRTMAIPHEIVNCIFSYLSFEERIRLTSVCKQWQHLLLDSPEMWNSISHEQMISIAETLTPYRRYIRPSYVRSLTLLKPWVEPDEDDDEDFIREIKNASLEEDVMFLEHCTHIQQSKKQQQLLMGICFYLMGALIDLTKFTLIAHIGLSLGWASYIPWHILHLSILLSNAPIKISPAAYCIWDPYWNSFPCSNI